ncbi:MAG: beta-ketoacyl-[acyl-carrier-protein] synthase family protein, partial [Planctomycetaceae bacterium]
QSATRPRATPASGAPVAPLPRQVEPWRLPGEPLLTAIGEPLPTGIREPLPTGIREPLPTGIREPLLDLAWRAAWEAWLHARLDTAPADPDRIACVLGTSKGGWQALHHLFREVHPPPGGLPSTTQGDWPGQFLPSAPGAWVAARLGLRGPLLCPVAACATGLLSVHRAADLIAAGRCDVALSGSVDASLVELVQASFRRLGVLAPPGGDPARAVRPFDRDRRGFVVGEGAAVLVLERVAHARARGVAPLATWLAGGLGSEAKHLMQLDPDPAQLAHVIGETLARAGLDPREIDCVGYHGTATRGNDPLESAAVLKALGPHARSIPGSSLKGALGHLLGAAGSVELAALVLALRDGVVPPTVNLTHPDPACPLDYTPGRARPVPLQTALKLSLGFGGHLACALLRRGSG